MGFTLSCFFFETFSTFLNWVIDRDISPAVSMDYLDDFLFVGPPNSTACSAALAKFIQMSDFFGVPLASEKTVFPATRIEFLGITINSLTMEFLLPENKIARIVHLLRVLIDSKKTTLKQLQSL